MNQKYYGKPILIYTWGGDLKDRPCRNNNIPHLLADYFDVVYLTGTTGKTREYAFKSLNVRYVRALERRRLLTFAVILLNLLIMLKTRRLVLKNRYVLNLGDDSPLILVLKSRRYVFDLGDPCLSRNAGSMQRYDNYIRTQIQRADIISTTAKSLQLYVERLGGSATIIENGTDYEVSDATKGIRPNLWPTASSQVFAYVGGLNSRVDFDFLIMLAKTHPDTTLFCTSRPTSDVADRVNDLEQIPNIILSGYISDDEVTFVLANCTAGVIPFTVDFIGDCINPQKLYDYCAFGKPIISTKTAEMLRFAEYVIFPETSNESRFQSDVSVGLKVGMLPNNVQRRILFANGSRWRHRADVIRALLLGETC